MYLACAQALLLRGRIERKIFWIERYFAVVGLENMPPFSKTATTMAMKCAAVCYKTQSQIAICDRTLQYVATNNTFTLCGSGLKFIHVVLIASSKGK